MNDALSAQEALAFAGSEQEGTKNPPLIFIGHKRTQIQGESFRSILEHEMVHVNQAILDRFPSLEFPDHPTKSFDSLISVIEAEYQANLLQLTKWPHLYPHTQVPLTLDHWCIFRGYTQAIEHLTQSVLSEKVSISSFAAIFDDAQQTLPRAFEARSLDLAMANWLLPRVKQDLGQALKESLQTFPHLSTSPATKELREWLRSKTCSGL